MSDVSEHSDSDFYFPKKKKKEKEKRGGHMIKCLLTELGRAGRENVWPSYSVNKYILFFFSRFSAVRNPKSLNLIG